MTLAAPSAHTAAVTGVDWYSVDNGLFVSGSKDCTVKLWDPNVVKMVTSFNAAAAVAAVAAAPPGAMAAQVAAGCADGCVRLFDVTTGAPTQTLTGTSARAAAFTATIGQCCAVLPASAGVHAPRRAAASTRPQQLTASTCHENNSSSLGA